MIYLPRTNQFLTRTSDDIMVLSHTHIASCVIRLPCTLQQPWTWFFCVCVCVCVSIICSMCMRDCQIYICLAISLSQMLWFALKSRCPWNRGWMCVRWRSLVFVSGEKGTGLRQGCPKCHLWPLDCVCIAIDPVAGGGIVSRGGNDDG